MPLSTTAGADQIFNKTFVHSIKRHPCIYNVNQDDHSRREVVDAAWQTVADEAEDTVKNCKLRWKNLRTAFLRSVKQGTRYYLDETMQFVLPYLKPRQPFANPPPSGPASESDYSEEREIEVTNVHSSGDVEPDEQKYSATIEFDEQIDSPRPGKSQLNVYNNINNDGRGYSPLDNLRSFGSHRLDHHYSSSKPFNVSDEDNADVDFLKSLLPDMRGLNGRQRIKLKRRFLEVMEEILYEDKDNCADIVKRNGGQASSKLD